MEALKLQHPIITSLMDSDKYKKTMQQVNLHRYPKAEGVYRFKCRTPGVDLTPIIPALRDQLEHVATLRYTEAELRFLAAEDHLSPDYIDYLSDFRLDASQIHVDEVDGQLDITAMGAILKVSDWEIYTLALVNELYYRSIAPTPDLDEGRRRLQAKIDRLTDPSVPTGFSFAEFGTRRRFSKEWQDYVVGRLVAAGAPIVGTSNYKLAKDHGLTPIGTMAHEYLQIHQALVHPLDAQRAALQNWAEEYRGNLGDALTDVIGMDAFCKDADLFFAKLFTGGRHDSGDPYVWGYKLIDWYKSHRLDPAAKTAIFSDGLNVDKMLALYGEFHSHIKTGFGWGTDLTNDLGYKPLNIVMKIVECNGRPVAKLSDSPGKTMCENQDYVAWLAGSYGRREEFV